MAPNFVNALLAQGLLAGATGLEDDKANLVADAPKIIDPTLTNTATALKTAVNSSIHGFAAFMIPTVDSTIDKLDAEGQAQAPTEVGALIDFVVAQARAEAARLQAA